MRKCAKYEDKQQEYQNSRSFLSRQFIFVIYFCTFVNYIYFVTLLPVVRLFTSSFVYPYLFIAMDVHFTVCRKLIYVLIFNIIQVVYLRVILLKTNYYSRFIYQVWRRIALGSCILPPYMGITVLYCHYCTKTQ